jgi:hypothetical protein
MTRRRLENRRKAGVATAATSTAATHAVEEPPLWETCEDCTGF